jgi:hypothetical protein
VTAQLLVGAAFAVVGLGDAAFNLPPAPAIMTAGGAWLQAP